MIRYRNARNAAITVKLEAETLASSKKYKESIDRYEEAVKKLPTTLTEELCFLENKSYFDNLLKIKKNCLVEITLLLMKIEDYAKVVEVASYVIEHLDDRCAEVYYRKGLAEERLENIEESLNNLRSAKDLDVGNEIYRTEYDRVWQKQRKLYTLNLAAHGMVCETFKENMNHVHLAEPEESVLLSILPFAILGLTLAVVGGYLFRKRFIKKKT
eukprot:TRINITY_DN10191_c0_g1_i2.p1 TRINITY_DN10191_c0_g1~~TRINITY_DN10191_c0_g1_i2.p1  ORF type:complete len:214 (+),score=46.72 TRINITY_DN10191_c0_g1_i2:209-850(+)